MAALNTEVYVVSPNSLELGQLSVYAYCYQQGFILSALGGIGREPTMRWMCVWLRHVEYWRCPWASWEHLRVRCPHQFMGSLLDVFL